jgi:hypothetical protein
MLAFREIEVPGKISGETGCRCFHGMTRFLLTII